MESPCTPNPDRDNEAALGSDAPAHALAAPGRPNEGGTPLPEPRNAGEALSPRLVIRGENPSEGQDKEVSHSTKPNPAAAFVDWLNFTFHFQLKGDNDLSKIDLQLFKAFGFGLGQNRYRKHLNYEQSWVIGADYGIFATGGPSVGGTSFVSLSGVGCSAIRNWTSTYRLLKALNAKITRIDLAHDDFLGRHNVLEAKTWWEEGRFNLRHGRPPKAKLIDDLGSGLGNTFYLGSRKSGKLLRVYEKGKQLGNPLSSWVRWELEQRSVDRDLKHEMLLSPGAYLAGAYPCLDWICDRQSRIATRHEALSIGLDVLLRHCSRSYGKLIWTLREGLGWTDDEIITALAVEGMPGRLLAVPVVGEDYLGVNDGTVT